MLLSMTGYGKGSAGNEKITAEVEVKSVNSRYLDIYFKLPSALMNREYELREIIKNSVKRGKLTVITQIKRNGVSDDLPVLDKEKLKAYLNTIEDVKKTANIADTIKLEHLLNSKEIFSSNDIEFTDAEFDVLKNAVNEALKGLSGMKTKEGEELAKDLTKRIGLMSGRLDEIENESAGSVNEYFGKFKEKVHALIEDTPVNNERLELELAILAEKSDITEECVRLRSHMKFFLESMAKESEPGRKLNFLCQEMNRETNTISSKSISTSITHNTVQIKEEIEKIREQIQNIE